MKKLFFISLLLLSFQAIAKTTYIIPLPQKCVGKKGYFTVNEKTMIILPEITDSLLNAVAVWRDLFKTATGYAPEITTEKRNSNVILCILNPSLMEESYQLNISPKIIQVEAGAEKGIFYAFQTLRQLLPPAIESSTRVEGIKWNIPCMTVEDSPSFSYRGMMLDVSRHFVNKEDIKAIYEMCL